MTRIEIYLSTLESVWGFFDSKHLRYIPPLSNNVMIWIRGRAPAEDSREILLEMIRSGLLIAADSGEILSIKMAVKKLSSGSAHILPGDIYAVEDYLSRNWPRLKNPGTRERFLKVAEKILK
jgi:hypothetical protein